MRLAMCVNKELAIKVLTPVITPLITYDNALLIFPAKKQSDEAMELLCEMNQGNAYFGNRNLIETDDELWQYLPYVIIRDMNNRILGYRRPSKNSEARLAGNFSIGFGGHIEPADCVNATSFNDICTLNAYREISEELKIPYDRDVASSGRLIGPVGLISDNGNEVGRHHLGMVYIYTMHDAESVDGIQARAADEVVDLKWYTHDELAKCENPENWTQFVIQQLVPILGQYPY